MDRATDIKAGTRHRPAQHARGSRTGTVLSKEYLYGVFGDRATHRWEPAPIVPVSGHAPDQFTMDAALAMVEEFDPHLVFVNLGDIDRFGHADLTGNDVQLARQLALADTDLQVQRFVDLLKATGRWEHSVVIVLADHSMDWSRPERRDQPARVRWTPTRCSPGKVAIADNGGADLLYWTGPTEPARRRRRSGCSGSRTRRPGVLAAHDRAQPVAAARPGGRRRGGVLRGRLAVQRARPDRQPDPRATTATRPPAAIPFFIGGGHPIVPRRRASSARARTVDVAPTVARFFGVGAPRGGYDGRSRLYPCVSRRRAGSAPCAPPAGSVVVHIGGRLALRKPP